MCPSEAGLCMLLFCSTRTLRAVRRTALHLCLLVWLVKSSVQKFKILAKTLRPIGFESISAGFWN